MCQLFNIGFEELLSLNDSLDSKTYQFGRFKDQDRSFVISQIILGKLVIDIPSELYQFSTQERMMILRAIKDGKFKCNLRELKPRLTVSEQKYLFDQNIYIGGKKI